MEYLHPNYLRDFVNASLTYSSCVVTDRAQSRMCFLARSPLPQSLETIDRLPDANKFEQARFVGQFCSLPRLQNRIALDRLQG